MSVKYYNPKTAQWEPMATSQAQGIKVIDSDGVLTYEDGEEVIRPTNVEDGLKSLGRKIKDLEATLEDHFTNHPSGSGGGGGGGAGGFMPVLTIQSPEVISTTVDEEVIFEFQFTSPNVGIAQAYLEISGTENRAYQMTLRRQGNFVGISGWNLGTFPMGTYTVSMYVVDAAGMYATMSSSCIIRSGSLTLTSNFVDSVDFFVSSNIYFPYYVQSISEDPITVKYQIDNNAEVALENIENGSYGSIDMGRIAVTGSHIIKVWAESGNMKSNVLKYTILVVDAKGMYLTVNLEKDVFEEGEAVTLYYRASKQNESYVTAFFYVDGRLSGSQSVPVGVSTLWNLGKGLDADEHILKIKVRTLDTTDDTENLETNTAIWEQTIVVKAGEFASIQPIQDGSELFIFDASGLAGEGATDSKGNHVWLDKGKNNIKCTLHDFNFTAATGGNGWDGDSLVFSGKSYAIIDCAPFNNSTNTGILADGFTLEICFSATDVGNPDASILWCKNYLAPNQGINATPYTASLKSQDGISMATSYIDSSYGEKWTTLSFSIKHYDATKPFETMCCYIYVNGVLTRLEPCTSNLFKYNGKIYLGAGLLENGTIGNFANCKIKSIRAYNRQLAENTMTIQGKTVLADETLINYISDQPLTKSANDTILTQQELWELNYGTETMPVVDIYHPNFFAMTVNDTFSCGIKYNDPTSGQGFDLTDSSGGDVSSAGPCPVSIQGTSSANYPVKNYTIELMQGGTYFKYAPRDNWEPGYRFTLKANYMDSSQANNIGIARFYNDLVLGGGHPLPTQALKSTYRASIDGFPVRLRVNGVFSGIYTFNMDRYAHESYGYSDTRQDIAYEIANNSDQFDVSGSNQDIRTRVSTGFKYRYHYADKGLITEQLTASESGPLNMASGLHEDLMQLVLWTGSSDGTEFKGNFSKHWSLYNMIDYHLLALAFGMVDSIMKNMVIASFGTSDDGEGNTTRIWYPLMYDGDTAMGLNNQGQLTESSGCDTIWNGVEFGNYDGYHSNLWNKFTELFASEIQERYSWLRQNGWFTVEKMMSYVYDDVIAKVGQKFYNEDMKFKYRGVGGAENSAADAEKLQKRDFCRGTREEYTRRWLTERLSYLDSRFQVGEEALSTAVVRSNSVSVLELQIETYHPQWVSVKFMDGTTPVLKRLEANTLTTFSSMECPDLINGMVTNPVNNNITISCVGNVKRLEGLINLQPSEIMIQAMPRLTSLDVRGTKKLCVLDVLNNKNLQTLNVKDCTKLGWEESVGAFVTGLNLTNCINLRHCDISNTGLTGLQLPQNSGALEYFDASNTNIDAIAMIGQPYIEEIKMTNCLKLGTVTANNCARLRKLNLANTTISSLDLSLCLEVEELDISGTSNLNTLSLAGCPNLKILNMSGFNSPNYNILNLASCPKVENLNLSGATNIVRITFAENATALKTLNLSSSSVESARFGANVEFPDYLDLARFNLSNIKFTNNPRIKHIKNLSYNGNGYQTFLNCSSLHTIECKAGGVFKLTGGLTETFWGCGALRNIPTNIDLSEASSGSRTFSGCTQLTMAQAKMIMDATKNTGLYSGNMWRFFEGCTGIKGQLPEDFFANAKALAGGNYFFTGCSEITGTLPPRLLQPCAASLVDIGYMFSGLNITGGIPQGFFDGMTKLTQAYHMFSNTKLNGVLPDKMFKDCGALTSVYNMFNGCSTLTGQIPADLFNYSPKLSSVAAFFSGCSSLVGEIPDTIFNLTTGGTYDDLIYVDSLFNNCSGLRGTEFPSYLFEYTPNILTVDYLFNGIHNLSAQIPNDFFQFTKRIQSAAYTFASTGAKGLFPTRLFRGLESLTNVAGIFSNCANITGTLPTCTSEDTKLFADNPLISVIDYMFSGCTALSGNIPENIFFGLEEDTSEIRFDITSAKGVFKNCATLSGRIPAKLLYKFRTCEDLSEFFQNCYRLQGAIPNGFLSQCTALKKCVNMFSEANGIGIREVNSIDQYCVPEDLFEKNYFLQNCSGMFYSWGNATPLPTNVSHGLMGAIPPGLFDNCQNLLDVSNMFAGQGAITGLLDGDLFRFNANVENLSAFVGGCGGITELGDGFLSNNKKVNNVYMMFSGCDDMVGTMTPIWENNYCPNIPASDSTKYQQCFSGCTKLTNYYTEIPKQWGGGKEVQA